MIYNNHSKSALVIASRHHNIDVVNLLSEYSCNHNVCDEKTESSVRSDAQLGHTDIVE